MKGHQQLISMRMKGWRPSVVFLTLGHDGLSSWRDWHTQTPHMAQVLVQPDESIALLDLRWAIGLTFIVISEDAGRAQAMTDALVNAQAARVSGAVMRPTGFPEPAWEVAEHFDTHGVLVWQD